MVPPLITLEEHFICKGFRESNPVSKQTIDRFPPNVAAGLLSLGKQRLDDMNQGKVALQIISHTPSSDSPVDLCKSSNDQLHQAVMEHKGSFAGFAMLPMHDPAAASEELRRCVTELGFVGALIGNHVHGRYYDDSFFWSIFETAQELDVPIYLHPSAPHTDLAALYQGNYSKDVAAVLSMYGWGWHSETGLHVLRLFASGLFDRFPSLKIIIGHMGEMLPYMLDRIEVYLAQHISRERGLRQVWDSNLWITTSGMFSLPPFACLLQAVKHDRILYSVDYPFATNEEGLQFMEDVKRSGLVNDETLEMIAYRNAESLLKVKVKK